MNDYNIFNNIKSNSMDFESFVNFFLNNGFVLEKALRTPKPSVSKQCVSNQDKQEFQNGLHKQIEVFKEIARKNGLKKHGCIITENGSYFLPRYLQGKHKKLKDSAFVRIYVGLHPSRMFEFFSMLDDLLSPENFGYYYKFYSIDDSTADRAVIYLENDGLFKTLEAIEKIKESKPYLFQGAVDKYFTTKVCKGIGVSGDLGLTFTETFATMLFEFFRIIMQNYTFDKNKQTDDIIDKITLKHIENLRKDSIQLCPGVDKNFLFNNIDDLLKQVREAIYINFDKIKNGGSYHPILNRGFTLQKEKNVVIYGLNMVNIFIKTLPKQQQYEIINKLTDYSLFVKLMPQIIKNLNRPYLKELSINNVCYTKTQIETLKQCFKSYIEEKELASKKYLNPLKFQKS